MWEETFGDLRSLLQEQQRDRVWRKALWTLLSWAHKENAAYYRDHWLPYLSAQDVWDSPLRMVRTRAALERSVAIAPSMSRLGVV